MRGELLRLPKGMPRPELVVISDRYPPDSYGGAELSLHIVLRGLTRPALCVVTFGSVVLPVWRNVDGVSVLTLPREGTAASAVAWVAEALTQPSKRVSPHESTHSVSVPSDFAPRGGVVDDGASFANGAHARMLCAILKMLAPKVVHADNYRAISLLSVVPGSPEMRRIGMVRDNRFHCVRYDQSATIDGKHCGACGLQCAKVDAPEHPQIQEAILSANRGFRERALRSLDVVAVTSCHLQREVSRIVDGSRIRRIANPADGAHMTEAMSGVAELPGTNLLVVGMLTENKGQIQLVKALGRLVDAVPDAVVHFAGRGDRISRRIEEVAAEQYLSERIVLHGYVGREELYALLRQCQIVVLPTVWPEPFGRVPLEAALARRPVVSFAVGGLRETIVNGETGIIVPPNDMGAMIAAIRKLSTSPAMRVRMGEAAQRHVAANYSVESTRTRLGELWQELLSQGSLRRG